MSAAAVEPTPKTPVTEAITSVNSDGLELHTKIWVSASPAAKNLVC